MGPSFGKIAEIALPAVLMTWKICLLRNIQNLLTFDSVRLNPNGSAERSAEMNRTGSAERSGNLPPKFGSADLTKIGRFCEKLPLFYSKIHQIS